MLDKIPLISVPVIWGGMIYLGGFLYHVFCHSSQSNDLHVRCSGLLCYIFCLSKCERVYMRAVFTQSLGLIYAIGGTVCVLVYDRAGLLMMTRWAIGLLFVGGMIWGIVDIVKGISWRFKK